MHIIDLLHFILSGPFFIIILFGVGVFYTLFLKFPQIRFLKKSIKLLLQIDNKNNKSSGETSAFQALATSLGGSIGVGCIAGTCIAINIGGPSSIFWLIITAFLSMPIKYVEVLLCHKYKKKEKGGDISGTPMNFMTTELNLKILPIITAIGLVLSSIVSGNMPQSNSISNSLYHSYGVSPVISGILLVILVSFIILGGIKRIGLVAEKLIPIMSLIFLSICLITICNNYKNILPSLNLIFLKPFNTNSITGGFIGTSILIIIQKGVNLSYYTNDSGSGISGIAHSTSDRENAYEEAVYAMIEPFLTTIIMCTLTALVILTSDIWKEKYLTKLDFSDITILNRTFSTKEDFAKIKKIIYKKDKRFLLNEDLKVIDGKILNTNITIINNRFVAEDLIIHKNNKLFSGSINISNGKIKLKRAISNIKLEGRTQLTGVTSMNLALKKGPLKNIGPHLLNICLILFAITTVIAWYYYGDRGLAFLGAGKKMLFFFKLIFIFLFFMGSLIDTSIIWKLSELIYVIVGIPTLISLFLMFKKVKKLTDNKV